MDEREHLVASSLGQDKAGLRFVKVEEPVLKSRQPEIIILFTDGFGRAPAIRTRVAGLGVSHIGFIEHAVLPGVVTFVNVAAVYAAAKEIVHHAGMPGTGSALETIDVQVQYLPLTAEFLRDYVREFLFRLAGGLGGPL